MTDPPDTCEVPGCADVVAYDSPGYWCEHHWNEWWNWPEEQDEPNWMSNPFSSKERA